MANTYMKLRVALTILSAIGFILYVVAFSLPKWSQYNGEYNGIWQICFINGGEESCSLWPEHLKTTLLQILQVLSSVGLFFYLLFVVSGIMTIFWTKRWKAARAIKFSTTGLAVLSCGFVVASVVIYKIDKGSGTFEETYVWYFAVIAAILAAILAPFYFIDACRTVAPKKLDREQFFRKINNPPSKTFGTLENYKRSRKPPPWSQVRQQQANFVHPRPKPMSKPPLMLSDEYGTEYHPAPTMLQAKTIRDNKIGTISEELDIRNKNSSHSHITSIEYETEIEEIESHHQSLFEFHETKTMEVKQVPELQSGQEQTRRKVALDF